MKSAPTHPPAAPMGANNGYEYREQLGAEADGRTLLAYLSRSYRHSSPDEWVARIASGQVLVDARVAHAETVLHRGRSLVWQRPPWVEPEAPLSFTVLYEDGDLLAVAKPAGLPTLPGANFLQSTLLHLVNVYAPGATPVHRLGRWTSGLVLCVRNPEARANITRQWSDKNVKKSYRALARGLPDWDDLSIATRIGPVPHALLGSVHAASATGKSALSHVTVIERRADSCLCDVRIATGRAHQIRIHLAAAGHPLAGDPLYAAGGIPAPDSRAVPGDPGYHLHSAELRFCHPAAGHDLVITCEPPPLLRLAADARR